MVSRTWPDERAFAYVKARFDAGEPINRNAMLNEDPEGKMVYTMQHETRFSSWRNFLSAFSDFYELDLDVREIERQADRKGQEERTKWSREIIKEKVLKYHSEGRDVSYTGVLEYDPELVYSVNIIDRRTGEKKYGYKNWGELLDDCGLSHAAKLREQNKARIETEIRELAEEHGPEILLYKNAKIKAPGLFGAALKPRFHGGWSYAVNSAGFKYGPVSHLGQSLDDDSLMDGSIKELARKRSISERKGIIMRAAMENMRKGTVFRDDLADKTFLYNGRRYKLLSQIDHFYGGTTSLMQTILSSGSIMDKNDLLATIYRETLSRDVLETLYDDNKGLIDSIARKVYNNFLKKGIPTLSFEELRQEGFLGFEQSARRFDKDGGAKFSSFLYKRVRGAMLDANERLLKRINRESSDIFWSDDGETDLSKFDFLLDEHPDPAETVIDRLVAKEALDVLGGELKRHKKVLKMRYLKGMTAEEVAEALGLSAVSIYKIKNQAISIIGDKIGDEW